MAMIFLSYRRSDSPQACRVYEWLVRRYGADAVFIDVSGIPFAVAFPDWIRRAIDDARVVIALIGPDWHLRVRDEGDPVRMEIEHAVAAGIPVWPVLIGNTPMPDPEALPEPMAALAAQNAVRVGLSLDFDTHMRELLPRVDALLGALARRHERVFDDLVITRVCQGVVDWLRHEFEHAPVHAPGLEGLSWWVAGARQLLSVPDRCVTLYLHRVTRLAEHLELHFLLSFWMQHSSAEHAAAGWVMQQLEGLRELPGGFVSRDGTQARVRVTIRRSDEDARQVWKMITDEPLRLSLTYIAAVSAVAPEPIGGAR